MKNTAFASKYTKKNKIKIIALVLLPILLAIVALTIGRYPVSFEDLWKALSGIFLGDNNLSATVQTVIFDVRIPRIIAAILIGMAYSVSGAAFQGTFRNPLVSPDILGVSAGAGFGATIAIINSWEFGYVYFSLCFRTVSRVFTYFIGNLIKIR